MYYSYIEMVVINFSVIISPQNLNENLNEFVKNKVECLLLNKEIRNVGFIKQINNINIDSENFSILYSGNIKCKTIIDADTYLPKVGDIIKTKIKTISQHGYYLDEPIETFVVVQKENIKKKKEGDILDVKITKVNYNNDKYIVLANLLNKHHK